MVERRRTTPTQNLRAEFGTRALSRAVAMLAVRVTAFVALCVIGSTFLIG